MEVLSDDNKVVGIKYFVGMYNGVKCMEVSVIKYNVCRIDVCCDKVFVYGYWFVIVL